VEGEGSARASGMYACKIPDKAMSHSQGDDLDHGDHAGPDRPVAPHRRTRPRATTSPSTLDAKQLRRTRVDGLSNPRYSTLGRAAGARTFARDLTAVEHRVHAPGHQHDQVPPTG